MGDKAMEGSRHKDALALRPLQYQDVYKYNYILEIGRTCHLLRSCVNWFASFISGFDPPPSLSFTKPRPSIL